MAIVKESEKEIFICQFLVNGVRLKYKDWLLMIKTNLIKFIYKKNIKRTLKNR